MKHLAATPTAHGAARSHPENPASEASAIAVRVLQTRRRRQLLESFFAPVVSGAALPSTVDRLVLWRSHHGRHLG